jgi:type I restriction enzyme, S subunit
MKAETFLEQFARLAEAPNGIPKLRELVLQLAVRGKLVPQDPNDEPSSVLVARIRSEKERLSSSRSARRRKGYSTAGPLEPFELPALWCWLQLDAVAHIQTGKRMKGGARSEGVISLGGEHLRPDGTVNYSVPRYVSEDFYQEMQTGQVQLLDTLMVKDGATTGKTALVEEMPEDGRAAVNEHVFILRRFGEMNPRALFLFVRALSAEHIAAQSQGIIGGIGMGVACSMPFPIPPLAEQKRIVAKVDELMALCDELESKQQAVRTKQIALNRASLHALAEPNGTSLATAWHRVRDQFDHLYTSPKTVNELRQTILQLAVMGRLLPQDPNDESAGVLLRQRFELPEGYVRRRKIQKQTPPNLEEDLFGHLPQSWVWKSVLELYKSRALIDYGDGNHGSLYPRKSEFGEAGITFVTAADIASGVVLWSGCKHLAEERANQLTKGWAFGGDVLLTHNATVGRVAYVEENIGSFLLGTSVTFYRLHNSAVVPRYLFYVLMSPVWQKQLRAVMEQTTRNQVSIQKQAHFRVPIPPLLEQERIVAKADQLMTLCDGLEAKLQQSQTDADNLLTAIVHELVGDSRRRRQ